MRGWISIVAASALLSAGLVAGRAAADSVAAPTASPIAPHTTGWSDPPVRAAPAPIRAEAAGASKAGPACTPQVWAPQPSGCSAQGRPVRVITLTQR